MRLQATHRAWGGGTSRGEPVDRVCTVTKARAAQCDAMRCESNLTSSAVPPSASHADSAAASSWRMTSCASVSKAPTLQTMGSCGGCEQGGGAANRGARGSGSTGSLRRQPQPGTRTSAHRSSLEQWPSTRYTLHTCLCSGSLCGAKHIACAHSPGRQQLRMRALAGWRRCGCARRLLEPAVDVWLSYPYSLLPRPLFISHTAVRPCRRLARIRSDLLLASQRFRDTS